MCENFILVDFKKLAGSFVLNAIVLLDTLGIHLLDMWKQPDHVLLLSVMNVSIKEQMLR